MPPKRKAAPGPASASAAAAASTTPKPPSYPSLVFAAVVLPLILGTYLSLQHQQLVPLYNSLPLGLHPYLLLAGYLGAVAAARAGFERASPATWAYLAALGVDFAELAGRRVASLCGTFLGPEWGAFAAQLVLSALPILGVAGCFFALTVSFCSLDADGRTPTFTGMAWFRRRRRYTGQWLEVPSSSASSRLLRSRCGLLAGRWTLRLISTAQTTTAGSHTLYHTQNER